LQLFLQVFFY